MTLSIGRIDIGEYLCAFVARDSQKLSLPCFRGLEKPALIDGPRIRRQKTRVQRRLSHTSTLRIQPNAGISPVVTIVESSDFQGLHQPGQSQID